MRTSIRPQRRIVRISKPGRYSEKWSGRSKIEPPMIANVIRVGRETKGRDCKGVTTVFDLPLDETGLLELAALLKSRCGTGGTVKDGRVEIQGDQRDRLVAQLE